MDQEGTTMAHTDPTNTAAEEIDARIQELGGWRGARLVQVRRLVRQALPDVVEEVKWRKPSNEMRGAPVWSKGGMICTFEVYKDKVKLTFAKGAALDDPTGLFNAGFGGNTRRAVDLRESDDLDEAAFVNLVRRAAAFNQEGTKG
jgi:hypothetical protein